MEKSNLFFVICSIAIFLAYLSVDIVPELTNLFLLIGAIFGIMTFSIRTGKIIKWFKSEDKKSNHTSEND